MGEYYYKNKKERGHLHLKNLYYVCYNERETDSMFFSNFCKEFNIELDMNEKMSIYNYLDKNWSYSKKEDFTIHNMDKLIDLEDFIDYINKNPNYILNLSPIQMGSIQWRYLSDRKIFNYENIYQANYKINDKWIEPVIVILNKTSDKLLGMQIRNLKSDKDKRIYKFINFQECYNMRFPDKPLDEMELISYNKISSIFNFLNVNYEIPVFIFEGYLDSVFFPNSISLVGLDTDISILSNENVDIKFVLDNDESGLRKSKNMIENNHSVFLWKKLINDLSKNKGSKYKNILEKNAKDINNLVEFFGDPDIYYNLKLNNYFAKDQFDLIDM